MKDFFSPGDDDGARCSAPKRATTHSTNQPGFEAAVTGFYVYVTVGLAATAGSK